MPDATTKIFTDFGQSAAFVAVLLVFLVIAKIIRDVSTSFDDDHLMQEKNNIAIGIRRFGLYFGLALAVVGALDGESQGFTSDLMAMLIYGALSLAILLVAQVINDKILLGSIDNNKEVESGNTAVGIVEAGSYIATGLIINGAFTGDGGGIWTALAFAGLGQVALIIFARIYESITPFKAQEEILKKNAAAGVALGGMLVALGIVLRSSVIGSFTDWVTDITAFSITAAIGMILLLVSRLIIDKIVLPKKSLAELVTKSNVASLITAEGGILAVAIIIAAVLR